jgi:orotidine-5'-phosphate decarboxylase
MSGRRKIFVALDTPDAERARELVRQLSDHVFGFKIGLQLFTHAGPEIVREVLTAGAKVFLDLKLHDIPNTVAGAAAAAGRLGVGFFTVHAAGGQEMIRRGVEASADAALAAGFEPPTVLAVTVLTSFDDAGLTDIGMSGPCADAVIRLATLAESGGAGGLVCSPREVASLRERFPRQTLVVPGIRPGTGSTVANDDQTRTASAAATIAAGATYLVIGRPITQAEDPVAAARSLASEIDQG